MPLWAGRLRSNAAFRHDNTIDERVGGAVLRSTGKMVLTVWGGFFTAVVVEEAEFRGGQGRRAHCEGSAGVCCGGDAHGGGAPGCAAAGTALTVERDAFFSWG